MKRNLLSLGLAIAAFMPAYAYDFSVDGIFYSVKDETSVAVTYETEDLGSYSGDVVIPSEVIYEDRTYAVTAIGEMAFAFSNLKSVTLPETLTEYEGYAFAYTTCETPLNLMLPNLKKMGEFTFYQCGMISGEITVPESVEEIGQGLFAYCKTSKVRLPDSLKTLPKAVFLFNSELEEVHLPCGIEEISDNSFFECVNLKEVNIPESVLVIGNGAFMDCGALESIPLPEGLTVIEPQAFQGCLAWKEELNIPASVKSIGMGAFYFCNNLKGNLILPENLEGLDGYAFYECSGLTGDVVIPDNVTELAEAVFYGCSGIDNVVLHDGVKNIDMYAMTRCSGLTSFDSKNVETINDYAFYSTGLERLKLGAELKSIGIQAFDKCDNLVSIDIDAILPPTIESDTFSNYSALLSVPEGCEDEYKNAPYWSNFSNYTNIGKILDEDETVSVYTLDGRLVFTGDLRNSEAVASGIYIIKTAKETKKIIL